MKTITEDQELAIQILKLLTIDPSDSDDAIANAYYDVSLGLRRLEERKRELRAILLERGTHATTNHIVSVQSSSRDSLLGMDAFKQAGLEAKIRELGLVKHTEYQTVKVIKKDT
jgi:hypothetical protein